MSSNFRLLFVLLLSLFATSSQAVDVTFTGTINTNATNRPFFDPNSSGVANDGGYVGTAVPGVDSISTVSGPSVQVLGTARLPDLSDGNGVPYGVTLSLTDISFTVEAVNGVLTDGGSNGLGIDSSAGGTDTNTNQLSGTNGGSGATVDEQLKFDNLQYASTSLDDPLGRLQPGASIGAPAWNILRSNDFSEGSEGAVISSDPNGTADVTGFGLEDPNNSINNNFVDGTFGPIPTAYLTSKTGNFRLKGIGFQVQATLDVAAEPDRSIFDFGNAGTNGDPNLTLTENGLNISLAPQGDTATLGFNNVSVGVFSATDPDGTGSDPDLRIDGSTVTPESLEFSFDKDVVFESMYLSNVSGLGAEPVTLSFVSGTNPFAGLTGYDSGGFSTDGTSITFTRSDEGDGGEFVFFGDTGQDEIIIEAGTVISLASDTGVDGGIGLRMLSVSTVGLAGDFNDDGRVDGVDFLAWQRGESPNPFSASDLQDWENNYGAPIVGVAVPEPSALVVFLSGILAFSIRRTAKR